MATWHTPDTVRAEWPDAVQIDDGLLGELVIVARDAVIAYAPALPQPSDPSFEPGFGHGPFGGISDENIPTRYRLAQLIQVKNVWNATIASGSGDLGGETYTIQPRPLDWHVKALLRPAVGRPRVG
ncbi:hypothetical protein [Microbacterium hydrocarbonoxydans]|uniref:hypothetical protein n=1 Tax=Microbacterium hydrocarbonoxydans TaxID=273678 RepID=UPI00203F3E1F|nr:hypothetical protein [Microbacterium hydrocarbonoxydans]MCM3778986.1 hypothetical protein [Microbacterium hydrocarbonoxydans]